MISSNTLPEVQDLKQKLEQGKFRSIIDLILEGIGRPIQKLLRRSHPIPAWMSALIIALLLSLIGLLAALFSGGVSQYGHRTLLLGGGVVFLFFVIPKSINLRTVSTIQDHLLDDLEGEAGISEVKSWLLALTSKTWPLVTGTLYMLVNIVYGAIFLEDVNASVETAVVGFPLFFIAGVMIYFLLLLLILPSRLSQCHYRLNSWDTVGSEVISHLSGLFNYIAYMIAFLLATVALFTVSLMIFDVSNLILIVPTWLILIIIFIANQRSLSRIIKRTKRESLKHAVSQMTTLKDEGNLSDKGTLESLNRLWDYHDRIKGTRNSVLDLKGAMNFINTLLIPLVGFLFANLNNILKLLGWVE